MQQKQLPPALFVVTYTQGCWQTSGKADPSLPGMGLWMDSATSKLPVYCCGFAGIFIAQEKQCQENSTEAVSALPAS